MIEKINEFLNKLNLDLRISKNGRFIDQKVTPDVLSFMADCIMNYTHGSDDVLFSIKHIWESDYFKKNVKMIFGKPSPENTTVNHEYDKFIAQPIKTMGYAGLLGTEKKGRTTYFHIKNKEILEYIALKDRYAFNFLLIYLTKVFQDSDFIKNINKFINLSKEKRATTSDFLELKEKYQKFIIGNTKINGKVEVNRIFTKVINIFSCENGCQGTLKGHLSKRPIYYSDLMYNRVNFRDLDKEKGISRQELVQKDIAPHAEYNEYLVSKAINFIKNKYHKSEIEDEFYNGSATHVHHIFPKGEFPGLARYLENLIKVTPEQHYTKAHPNGNTHLIDKDYQLICLISKSETIEKSIKSGEIWYSKPNFIYVINSGLLLTGDNQFAVELEFNKIREKLKTEYKK